MLTPHEELHKGKSSDKASRYSARDRRALKHHYSQFFGQYFRVIHERVSSLVHIDVYIYGASPDRPYVTLATSGMGAADPVHDNYHPIEMITYLSAEWDFASPVSTILFNNLLIAGRYPHEAKELITKHDTLCVYDGRTNLADALFPGSPLTHWYFRSLIHEPKEIDHLILPSGRHVNFVWAYPITRHELHFMMNSENKLELECLLAEEADIPISLDRKCLIRPENRAERRARLKIQTQAMRKPIRQPWMELPCEYPPHNNQASI